MFIATTLIVYKHIKLKEKCVMSMFETYDNLQEDYTPDNTSDVVEYATTDYSVPRKVYNAKNEFIGYSWNYGETFTLPFTLKRSIRVKSDSLIYTNKYESPDSGTTGYVGQKAYNTVDCKSWTCVSITDSMYLWVEDEVLMYQLNSGIVIDLEPDASNRDVQVEINNFRWEPIHTFSKTGAIDINCVVDKDISEKLKPGVYYCIFSEIYGSKLRVISKTALYVK